MRNQSENLHFQVGRPGMWRLAFSTLPRRIFTLPQSLSMRLNLTARLSRSQPPPSPVKRYPARPRVRLPDPSSHLRGQLPEVLLSRRTHRYFGTDRVSLEQLSILLRLTWGFTSQIHWPGLGTLPVKTSPSGGARHSLEAYLWCSKVNGLPEGIYHYRPGPARAGTFEGRKDNRTSWRVFADIKRGFAVVRRSLL